MLKILLSISTLLIVSQSYASTPLLSCQAITHKEKLSLTINKEADESIDYVLLNYKNNENDTETTTEYFTQLPTGSVIPALKSGALAAELYSDHFKDENGSMTGTAYILINALPNDPNKMYTAQLYAEGNTYVFICRLHKL